MATTTPAVRGTFIVIEGLDRSGKTTQVAKLKSNLESEGHKVYQMRFPDRTTTIGKMINEYLQSKSELEDHVIHLLFSANRWELAPQIEQLLKNGTTIICDRYSYSGMIYSAAKRNKSLSLSWAREPDVGLPRPDIVVFLNLSSAEAEARGGFGEEKYEKRDLQEEVRRLFMGLMESEREEKEDMIMVNAGSNVDVVADDVLKAVKGAMDGVRNDRHGSRGEVRRIAKWKEVQSI